MTDPYLATTLIAPYLSQLASPAPTPGGGSGSAAAGAIGAALIEMVINISLRSAGDATAATLRDRLTIATDARTRFIEIGTADERAYNGFRVALALPKTTDDEKAARRTALDSAAIASAQAPLDAAILAESLLAQIPAIAGIASPHLRADLGAASHLLAAAGRSAIVMVDTNLVLLKKHDRYAELAAQRNRVASSLEDALQTALSILD